MSFKGAIAQLAVKLIGETKDFQKEMTESAKRVKAFGDDLQASGKRMTMGVTLPLVAAGTAAVKFASDLDESRNKASVVFGDMSSSVLDFASTSATALGMSEEAALGITSTYGSLLKNVGMLPEETAEWSRKLTQLTSDYASFHNLKPEEAFEKIKAGLVGSSEPLLSLGKDMRVAAVEAYALENGLMASGEQMDNLTMTQARLGTLMSQSNDEWGDFVRTSDGVANSSRIVTSELVDLAAGFGQDLIPMVKDVLGVVKPLLETFNEMPEGTRKFIITMAAASAAAGPLISATGNIISSVSTMSARLAASGATGVGALTSMVNPAFAVTGALVAVSGAAYKVYETSELLKEGHADVQSAMAGVLGEATSASEVYSDWADALERANDEWERETHIAKYLINMNKITKNSIEEMGYALAATGTSYDDYLGYLESAIMQTGWLSEEELIWMNQQPNRQAALVELVSGYGLLTEEMYGNAAATNFLAEVQGNEMVMMQEFGLAAAASADGLESLKVQQADAAEAAERLAAAQKTAQDAANATAQSYIDLGFALKDATKTEVARTEIGLLDEMFSSGDIDRQTYMTAVSEIGLAYGLMDEKSAALAGNLPIMNQLMADGVIPAGELDEAMGLLFDEAGDGVVDWEALLDEMDITPESAEAVRESMNKIRDENLELMTANEDLLLSWQSLNTWAENNVIDLYINQHVTTIGGNTSSSDDGPGVPGYDDYFRANGGPILAGQPYIINERGPGEVFVTQENGYMLNRQDAMNSGDPVSNAEVVRAIQNLGNTLATKLADELSVRG